MKKNKDDKKSSSGNGLFYNFIAIIIVAASIYYLPSFFLVKDWALALGMFTIVLSFLSAVRLILKTLGADNPDHI